MDSEDSTYPSSRNVSAGRDILAPIITGDIYVHLESAPRLLQTYIKLNAFKTLIEQRTRTFVGREFLFRAIYNHLTDATFTSGYIILHGEPGIGKTSVMTRLVQQLQCVHHFNSRLQGIRSVRDFLGNTCAQLATVYGLNHTILPPEALEQSAFLSELLHEASARRDNQAIVLVIDALDEVDHAETRAGENVLLLPASLPDGVFIIVSTREQINYHLQVDRRRDIYLSDGDPHNTDDVRRYILQFIEQHRTVMGGQIANWHITENAFVDQLTDKSQGNFMYLVLVLDDIRTGRIGPETINSVFDLPTGLQDYYLRHWNYLKTIPEFERLYKPVICHLAAAFEPVSAAQIGEWARITADAVHDVVTYWRQFFNMDRLPGAPPVYRLYHSSFQEFLNDVVGLREYHQSIAETALAKILHGEESAADKTHSPSQDTEKTSGWFQRLTKPLKGRK